jgi:hypothetical protein
MIVGRTITKKTISKRIITGTKGTEEPTIVDRKDKSKSVVVDNLLLGIGSPFTRWVANYQLLEKFKVPQILSYVGDGDPPDHL